MSSIINAMSVDVEDYFQVSAFENTIHRSDWDHLPKRVEANTQRILELFARHNVKATFFTLGWIAERFPQLIRDIIAGGHELASHGYGHLRATDQTRLEFRDDIVKAKHLLEDLGGKAVVGYRAPSYSISKDNLWVHDELLETGHQYSSSIYPINHDHYGIPDAPRFKYQCDSGLWEIPITTVKVSQKNLPFGGGGYFRLYPYWLSRWGIHQLNAKERQSAVFYFHPWEIDAAQPRQNNISFKTKFRHYLCLHRMEPRLETLLKDFQWNTMKSVFLPQLQAGNDSE